MLNETIEANVYYYKSIYIGEVLTI